MHSRYSCLPSSFRWRYCLLSHFCFRHRLEPSMRGSNPFNIFSNYIFNWRNKWIIDCALWVERYGRMVTGKWVHLLSECNSGVHCYPGYMVAWRFLSPGISFLVRTNSVHGTKRRWGHIIRNCSFWLTVEKSRQPGAIYQFPFFFGQVDNKVSKKKIK